MEKTLFPKLNENIVNLIFNEVYFLIILIKNFILQNNSYLQKIYVNDHVFSYKFTCFASIYKHFEYVCVCCGPVNALDEKKHEKGKLKTMTLFNQYVGLVFLKGKNLSCRSCGVITIKEKYCTVKNQHSLYNFFFPSDLKYSNCTKNKTNKKR